MRRHEPRTVVSTASTFVHDKLEPRAATHLGVVVQSRWVQRQRDARYLRASAALL